MLARIGSYLAPVILIVIMILGIRACTAHLADEPYEPIRFVRLAVEPETLVVGQEGMLMDGICNDSEQAVTVQLYLGAQSEGATSFGTQTVDLLSRAGPDGTRTPVKDTEEGRLRQVIEPGCTAFDPIRAMVPATLTPGIWRLRSHAVAVSPSGEVQHVTITSKPFRVIPAPVND